jgi:hypothetical protein
MAQKKEFLLRINPEVWRQLQAWAADELRSVNGQIEFILRQAVETRRKKNLSEMKEKTTPEKS